MDNWTWLESFINSQYISIHNQFYNFQDHKQERINSQTPPQLLYLFNEIPSCKNEWREFALTNPVILVLNIMQV